MAKTQKPKASTAKRVKRASVGAGHKSEPASSSTLAICDITITCDSCNCDCTAESWFNPATKRDWCNTCVEKYGRKKRAVKQKFGVAA